MERYIEKGFSLFSLEEEQYQCGLEPREVDMLYRAFKAGFEWATENKTNKE